MAKPDPGAAGGRSPVQRRALLLLSGVLGVLLAAFLLVAPARSQIPPAGCVSNTGGPCVTLCNDGTWSSQSGAQACAGHGGLAGGTAGPSPTPTPSPTPPATGPAPIATPPGVSSPAPPPLQSSSIASGVPFPSPAAFSSTSAPPQNIFYVSPEGCDPAPAPATNCGVFSASSLLCPSTNPCKTIDFALQQASDGDAIDLQGGTYDIDHTIELNKLVTIQPSTVASTQVTTAPFVTCTPSVPPIFTCTGTLSSPLLPGATITIVASGNAPVITGVLLNTVGVTPCTAAVTPPPSATASITCGPGQTAPTGSQIVVTVNMVTTSSISLPTVTLTVNAPTLSNRPILRSTVGGTLFHVTAVGSPALHVIIFGLTMGDATSVNRSAAIVLDNDAYTEISHDVIGSQDLPNAIGILLSASNMPLIHDNTIQGSTLFPRTATMEVDVPGGGYGVVTDECLGNLNHSNGVQLVNNLFAKNSNAGIWFCSDGTGGFVVNGNSIWSNGRGIVLYDAVDTVISGNTIGDNVLDGIDLLEGAERNSITGNTIESQQGNTSIGILLAGRGALFPLGNQIGTNQLRRNTVDIAIVGAQGTQIQNNSITALGTNTGVLFTLGLPGGWSSGQPINTVLSGNAVESSGSCTATNGCAIRLTAGVTTPIDATGSNAFGTNDPAQIQAQIWDHGRDPALGTVYVLAPLPPPTAAGILGLPPTPAPGVTPQGIAAAPVPVSNPPTVLNPPPATATAPAGAGGPAMGTATAYIDPATSQYYVPLLFCLTDSSGAPLADDALTVTFYDQAGTLLGTTSVMTDSSGCFNGNVAPDGGTTTLPAQVTVADASGQRYVFTVQAGNPPDRAPVGPVQ